MNNPNEELVPYELARPRLEALGWEMIVEQNKIKFLTHLSDPFFEAYCIPDKANAGGVLENMAFWEESIAWLEEEKQRIDSGKEPNIGRPSQEEQRSFCLAHPELASLMAK